MTSNRTVELYFSFVSLWSYIGSRRFHQLLKQTESKVIYKPINLLHTFSISGGLPVKQRAEQRQAYRLIEMERWKRIRDIELVLNPKYYPADPSLAHRVLIAATEELGHDNPSVQKYVHAGLEAVWARELDISNPETVNLLADEAGLEGIRLVDRARKESKLAEFEATLTEEAGSRKVFGAPFYFYQNEPLWGQDRLEMLEEIIQSGRSAILEPKYTAYIGNQASNIDRRRPSGSI
ncbi:thioredoxin-like protein [Penicillium cosmopolitanum]|uniref:Glutathione S-transferase kappa n=1 Tax=Penicillium cosmopolitanum TaxID=1131564 RepID=A0A9W9W5Q2_9EURO|nr:thioredoxin-like protein [Penicillium cosmopolitanum]KAJ5403892.1 thioredoxin-like protein [Penicillium cosmopolitanum]